MGKECAPSPLTDSVREPIGVGSTGPQGDPIGGRGRERKATERGAGGGGRAVIGREAFGGRAGGTQGLLDTSAILGAALMVSVSAFPA